MTEIDLIVRCPTSTCLNVTPIQWYCSVCLTKSKLTEQGFIKCSSSKNCMNTFLQYIRFNCSSDTHKNENNFYNSATDFINALQTATLAGKLSTDMDQRSIDMFVVNVMLNVQRQWKYKD